MKTPPVNLLVLKKTRRKPETGDLFVFQLEQLPDRFFWGRVVATDTKIGGMRDGGVILVYLYNIHSPNKVEIPSLTLKDLLIPPLGTNALAWTRGFFEVIQSGKNKPEDLLPRHCFVDFFGRHFDEYGNRIQDPVAPIGSDGVSGIGTIDLEVSQALGLPQKVI